MRALLSAIRIAPRFWLAAILALPLLGGCHYLERWESGFRDEEPAWGRGNSEDVGAAMGLSRKSREVERNLGIE